MERFVKMLRKVLKRKILILGVLVVTVAIIFLITRPKEGLSTDYTIPQNTKMILHFSTLTNTTTNFFPKPTSLIYFCDEAGEVIGELEKKEEVMRNFIVKGEDTVAFLFKNNTILATTDGYTDIKPNSDIFIHKDRFGPSKTGYLEDENLFYSLLNVGRRPNEEDYINTVRFVSEEQNYDVMIPYYLECISYDCVDKRFICMVSDLNDSLTKDTYNYVVLYYDEEINQFVLDETLYEVPYPEERYYNAEDRSFTTTLANNGYLYSVSVTDTEEYINNINNNGIHTHGNLILTTIDMEKRIAADTMLKENYDAGELGYGVLTGSDHLPMEAIGDKLYVFTSEFDVFVIKNQDEITQQKMPYVFQESISLYHPLSKEYNEDEDFFGSEVKIHKDHIYILTLFPKKVLKLNKLLEDGTYELVWEGRLPDIKRKDMFLNTYEIID